MPLPEYPETPKPLVQAPMTEEDTYPAAPKPAAYVEKDESGAFVMKTLVEP